MLETKVVMAKADMTLSFGKPGDDGNYSALGSHVHVARSTGPEPAASAKARRSAKKSVAAEKAEAAAEEVPCFTTFDTPESELASLSAQAPFLEKMLTPVN